MIYCMISLWTVQGLSTWKVKSSARNVTGIGWRFEESEPKMSELERTLEGIYPTTLILQIGLRQRNKSAQVTKPNRVWFNSCNKYILDADSLPGRAHARCGKYSGEQGRQKPSLTELLGQWGRQKSQWGAKHYGGKSLPCLGEREVQPEMKSAVGELDTSPAESRHCLGC